MYHHHAQIKEKSCFFPPNQNSECEWISFQDSFICDIVCITLFDWSIVHVDVMIQIESRDEEKNTSFNKLESPFLKRFDSIFFSLFRAHPNGLIRSIPFQCSTSNHSIAETILTIYSHSIRSSSDETRECHITGVNAHVSIETKPFDSFARLLTIFHLGCWMLQQSFCHSIYLWFASFHSNIMNPCRQFFNFFSSCILHQDYLKLFPFGDSMQSQNFVSEEWKA